MTVNPVTPSDSPAANASPTGIQKPSSGFWALFWDPQHPEAAPDPSKAATGPTGFEALFGNTAPLAITKDSMTTAQLTEQFGNSERQQILENSGETNDPSTL